MAINRASILTFTGVALGAVLLTFGWRLSGEASQGPGFASTFSVLDAEKAVRTACESRSAFIVLDTFGHFDPANIDDDSTAAEAKGGQVRHGDIVAAIVESSHPGAIAYQTDPVFSVASLAADFGRLATDIETGKLAKPAAIVSSIVLPVDLGDINAHAARPALFVDKELLTRREDVLRVLTDNFNPANPYTEIDRQLGRLRAADVPVFVAAGNTGPDATLNVLALSEGVFAIGALDRDGARTTYTSAPGLVSVWSPGFVVLSEAPGGLSVSGGRAVELEGASLAEQKAVIAATAGKKAKDLVKNLPVQLGYLNRLGPSRQRNRYLAMALAPGLYRTEDLMAAYGYPPSLGTSVRAVAEGPYMHYPSDTIFQSDAKGLLRFDPAGDGAPGQIKVADATSFAAPNLCASELFPTRRDAVAGSKM